MSEHPVVEGPPAVQSALLDALRGRASSNLHVHIMSVASQPCDLADLDPAAWQARAEQPILDALHFCQRAYRDLPDGGTIVLVVPPVAVTGAPGRVAEATAAEAIHLLAKGAARRWGSRSVTVHVVLYDDATIPAVSLRPAPLALPTPRDLADAVCALAQVRGLTGASLTLDGGALMLP